MRFCWYVDTGLLLDHPVFAHSWSWNVSRMVSILRSVGSAESPSWWAAGRHRDRRASVETPNRPRARLRLCFRRGSSSADVVVECGWLACNGRRRSDPSSRPFRHRLRQRRRHHAQRTVHQTEVASVKVLRKAHRIISTARCHLTFLAIARSIFVSHSCKSLSSSSSSSSSYH